jgi:hypothetical protein
MTGTIGKIGILTTLAVTGVLVAGFLPLHLPIDLQDAITDFVLKSYLWQGFLPIITIYQALAFIFLFEIAIITYSVFKWIIT